jgi:hypothetical protein
MPTAEPTDRSMLRVITTIACPMAIGSTTAALVVMRLNMRGEK